MTVYRIDNSNPAVGSGQKFCMKCKCPVDSKGGFYQVAKNGLTQKWVCFRHRTDVKND